MPEPLVIERRDDIAVISIHAPAELDADSTQEIHDGLLAAAQTEGLRGIVLDLDAAQFLTSPVVGSLLTARRAAETQDIAIVVARLRAEAAHIFRMQKLDKVFTTFDSVDAAVAGVAG